jgi:hypothetical protein
MTQISRPFQIALLAMGLFVAVWFVALRGHSASTNSSSSPAPASAPSPSSQAAKAAAPSSVYHGAAPGVEGLTRAIAKAHGAVATSQQNAKQLQEKSAQASSPTSTGTAAGAPTAGSQTTSSATSSAASKGSTTTKAAVTHKGTSNGAVAPSARSHRVLPSMQVAVEKELTQGKIVAILFWNPKALVDVAVRRELHAVGHALGGKIAVHDALASQVGSFGTITQTVQVYQTPTILIVNKRGQTTTLTGLTDVFSIQQAIDEARHA